MIDGYLVDKNKNLIEAMNLLQQYDSPRCFVTTYDGSLDSWYWQFIESNLPAFLIVSNITSSAERLYIQMIGSYDLIVRGLLSTSNIYLRIEANTTEDMTIGSRDQGILYCSRG